MIIVFFSFTTLMHAQAEFDTCHNVHRFEGEWLYANGNDTIRIYLRTQRDYYPDYDKIEDRIFGWHEYKQGNTVIESVYSNRFMTISDVDTITEKSVSIGLGIASGAACENLPYIARGAINDYLQGNQGKIVKATLNAAGNQLTWEQWNKSDAGMFGQTYGMTLPREFILIKQ
ncbi:MAG: hypothetical protein JST23_03260 [Bacteroidetes bacterium]|nr:hypothetical protein [Bacteroidota bacterium]